jgi:hypothetical protein
MISKCVFHSGQCAEPVYCMYEHTAANPNALKASLHSQKLFVLNFVQYPPYQKISLIKIKIRNELYMLRYSVTYFIISRLFIQLIYLYLTFV